MASDLHQDTKCIIGQGSFGKVYKYCHQSEEYALKKIYKDSKNHPELIERIEAEGRIMQKVANHRNVVGFIGEVTKGKHLYLLTEFVPDGDLRRINYLPTEDDLWEIVMQMAMVLQHLRKNNVVHRDIKPENILIKSTSSNEQEFEVVLKLADFGLAEIIEQGQYLQGIAGSPIYLAPEMCSHDLYSFEVDVWSLGITLFQLAHKQMSPYHSEIVQFCTEKPVHTEKQMFNFLLALIQTKCIKSVSPYPEINILISDMLNRDPKKRPTPLQILQHPKVIERIRRLNKSVKNNMELGKTGSTSTKAVISQGHQQRNFDPAGNLMQNNNTPSKNMQDLDKQLVYSPSPSSNSLQLFLNSRISQSRVSQLNFSLFPSNLRSQPRQTNQENKAVELI